MNNAEEKITKSTFPGTKTTLFYEKAAVSGDEVIHIWYDRT